MHTPGYYHGLGLDLHIRTKVHKFFSFIETVALRIGGNTLEIQSGGVQRGPHHAWMNGNEIGDENLPIIKEGFVLTTVSVLDQDFHLHTLDSHVQTLFHSLHILEGS